MAYQKNLLTRLHKWAIRHDENFLTESFAFVLEYLVENEPTAASRIISQLTGGLIELPPQEMRMLVIRTQTSGEEGIPDLELRTDRHFVIIEVKCEACATEDQLRRYRRILDNAEASTKGLVLLTRYPVAVPGADHYFRWYQVAEWISFESQRYSLKPTCQFMIDQFVGFLRERNMTMGQITWELPMGVRSLRTLADMLYEAALACEIKAQIKWSHDGLTLYIDGRKYWAGIEYDNPEFLVFGTNDARVNKESVESIGIGTTYEWPTDKASYGWRHDIDLGSEEIHFYARSKPSQMQFLEQFLRENYELARKLTLNETRESPPRSEISED